VSPAATTPPRPAQPPAGSAPPQARAPEPPVHPFDGSDVEETHALDEPAVHPLDAAAAALDAPRRSSRRTSSRSAERARRRADKRAEKAERKARARAEKQAAREADELEPIDEQSEDLVEELVEEPAEHADDEPGDETRLAPAEALVARLPEINPLVAAIISGALAGLAAVLMAIGASKGCEAVRDTSSCGGGAGLLALVAILAIEILIGANLLKAWQISDPFSTSFLGVGVVATIAMLTFLDELDSVWMLLVIPLMTAAAFALSWWITVRFIDEYPMASEVDSERGEPDFDDDAGPVRSQDEARGEDSTA
jgi:hypothetical protein